MQSRRNGKSQLERMVANLAKDSRSFANVKASIRDYQSGRVSTLEDLDALLSGLPKRGFTGLQVPQVHKEVAVDLVDA